VVAPIVGSTQIEHLDTAVRSVELSLSEEEVKTLEAPYRPHAVRGWL
jgi:aryl-alcohol dehydrogenase-like predicted oxidoreductase